MRKCANILGKDNKMNWFFDKKGKTKINRLCRNILKYIFLYIKYILYYILKMY